MTTFVSPFTGTVVEPTDVSYYHLDFGLDTDLVWPAVALPDEVPASRIMDCVPDSAGLHINLPAGGQGSVGSDILFRNLGAYEFSIVDYSGDSSVTIQPGESKYFYLTDNSTTDGVWANITFGTGTSAADAATLQGAGLTTLDGKLCVTQNIVKTDVEPTLNDASRAVTYVWTGGVGNISLPAAATLSAGWFVSFRNNGSGSLEFTPQGTSLINGLVNITVNPGDSGIIILGSDSNFYTVGLAPVTSAAFTSSTYDVDSISGSTLSLVSYAPIIQTYVNLSGTRTTNLSITLPAITQIYYLVNDTTGSYSLNFNVSGSTSPDIALAAGAVATVLSDGNQLFLLSQVTTGTYLANAGSAAAPSFSFSANNHTGMYLYGTNILGLSANSLNILKLDYTNTSAPIVTTPGEMRAALIDGGTA